MLNAVTTAKQVKGQRKRIISLVCHTIFLAGIQRVKPGFF